MESKLNESLTLTIVIPVYNTKPELLRRALLSVPNNENIGVVIYDDGSTEYDYTEIIRDWLENDPGFSWMNSDRFLINRLLDNIGLGAVRNKSIQDINSRYIMFLDSDDTLFLDDLNSIITSLSKSSDDFDVIHLGISLRYKNESGESEYKVEYWDDFVEKRLMIPYFTTSNIYKPEFLRNYDIYYSEERRVFEDIMFSIKLFYTEYIMNEGKRSVNWRIPIYSYYLEGDSLTRTDKLSNLLDDLLYWIESIKNFYKQVSSLGVNKFLVETKFKPLLFNRIRYEVVKALGMKLKLDGVYDEYCCYLDQLKPYKMDEILQ